MMTFLNEDKCFQEVLKELSGKKHQPSKEEIEVIFDDAEKATKARKTEFFDKICHELNNQLSNENTRYFCGQNVSLIDILYYCDFITVYKLSGVEDLNAN